MRCNDFYIMSSNCICHKDNKFFQIKKAFFCKKAFFISSPINSSKLPWARYSFRLFCSRYFHVCLSKHYGPLLRGPESDRELWVMSPTSYHYCHHAITRASRKTPSNSFNTYIQLIEWSPSIVKKGMGALNSHSEHRGRWGSLSEGSFVHTYKFQSASSQPFPSIYPTFSACVILWTIRYRNRVQTDT